MARKITWPEYKMMDNGMARNCFLQVDLLGPRNVSSAEIGESIRRNMRIVDVCELKKKSRFGGDREGGVGNDDTMIKDDDLTRSDRYRC